MGYSLALTVAYLWKNTTKTAVYLNYENVGRDRKRRLSVDRLCYEIK